MKNIRRKIIYLITLLVISLSAVGMVAYAAITKYTTTRGIIEVSSVNFTATTSYTSSTDSFGWIYNKAGDSKDINVTFKNSSEVNLHRYYKVELTEELNTQLASAILVYVNDQFVSSLAELDSNGLDHDVDDDSYIVAVGDTVVDKISFKLHQAAQNSIFNSKSVKLKVTTYSENVDYSKYIIVSSATEFDQAMEDIKSGLLSETPTIFLTKSITLTKAYTITTPLVINTNGKTLTGSLTINDTDTVKPDAILEILGGGSISSVTVGSYYDKAKARELVANYASEVLKYGITAGATPEVKNIIGPYGFYNVSVTTQPTNSTTFSTPNLTASTSLIVSKTETLIFSSNSENNVINFTHYGTKTSFDETNVLNHLPSNDEIIGSDVYLPTSIPGYNASIVWRSSNVAVMTNSGKIVSDSNDRLPVTLTATIKVNNSIYVKNYSFYVSSNNNKINFHKLVRDISPLVIKKKYSSSDADSTTYYLPIVTELSGTEFGNYDYRKAFTSPSSEPTFNWAAHEDIHLVSLSYEKYYDGTAQNPIDTFDYIDVNDNAITLVKDTVSNYAKVKIIGTFDNGEVYSSLVNISIAVGSDTELLEKAFISVNDMLGDVSVLGNILSTRISDGIGNEKGDFYLPSKYGDGYIISYEVTDNSGVITKLTDVVEIDGIEYYKFVVNPTKFTSTETAIPVKVTVTYTKTDGNSITKTKTIYVTTPAAVHISDMGNISIFNSLKYQVENTLPTSEKTNKDYSSTEYLGYDYILLRDIVGDVKYLSDYADSDLYLTLNGYAANGSDGANGISSVKLYNLSSNDASTTDTLTYDFVKLIEWATGDTNALASSVLSTNGKAKLSATQLTYKSNGETYLTENELSVLETFYKACTNDTTGAKWDAVKSLALETAPGRIYDNADLLVTILKCLTNEKGTNSNWWENTTNRTYGVIYAKYLEVVNRYAITTSEIEEPMSPAQEVYNSKYYYSFTSAADTNALTSFPCKYYDATGTLISGYCNRFTETNWYGYGSGRRQGTYAASSVKGNAAVDLYANASGYPYDSDHTKYITSAELMVLKAFWLGAISNKNDAATENVRHEFSDDSKALITAALAADSNGILPYPSYNIDDFQYYGQAILNAFDACLTIPTTFTSNGIGLLINSFYENYNGTGYKVRTYGDSEDQTKFVFKLVSGVPAVTNLDNLEGALSFFSNLTNVEIVGNSNSSIFLSDYGLSTAFARISLTNKEVTTLNMQYVSSDWNTFDLTNIKNFDKLVSINVSNNLGIKTINPLLNVKRMQYTTVNIYNIGEVYEYNAFVIDNLACTANVTYSAEDETSTVKAATGNTESSLVNLGSIEDLVSEHLYLTNVIYDENGNAVNVAWRIEEGNDIGDEVNQGGELDKITSVNEMNLRVSPYYYCESNTTFAGNSFVAKHVYKVTINDGILGVTDVTPTNVVVDIVDSTHSVESTTLTDSTGDSVNVNRSDEFDRHSTATSQTNVIYTQTAGLSEGDVSYNIYMYYQIFSFSAYNELTYEGNSAGTRTYYLRSNNTEIKASSASIDSGCYMVLLTEKQAQFLDFLNNNAFKISSAKMIEYGIAPDESGNVYLGIQNLSATQSTCYIFNPKSEMFMFSGGFDYSLGDKFSVTLNESNWNIKNKTTNKYLDCFKQLIMDNNVGSNVISAVFYSTGITSDSLTKVYNNNSQKLYNSAWTLSTNNVAATNSYGGGYEYEYSASLNTPTITVTTAEGKKYTATFNCYTIRNRRYGNQYTNPNTNTVGSKGYVYDNGATLLLSINNAQPTDYSYYFCLMTEAEINRLNLWYANPKDESFGLTVSREEGSQYDYYIYNPFTRRYATGTFGQTKGNAFYTTSVKPSYPFRLRYDNQTDNTGGWGYSICLYGLANGATTRYTTVSINASDYTANKYYVSDGNGGYVLSSTYVRGTQYYQDNLTVYDYSWNAYGGISDTCYGIATYTLDSGSLWVFDDVQTENQYVYTYQSQATTTPYIAYSLSYTINLVTAHIVRNNISRYYEFDKYYYLDEDTTIDGNVYKKGGIIRFEYTAYYGKSYEANILYYEVVFTYKKADGTTDSIVNPANLDILYYIGNGIGSTGSIEYFKATGEFDDYNQGFNITQNVWNEKFDGTTTSSDTTPVKNGKIVNNSGYLYLSTLASTKATITVKGFTTGSDAAADYLNVEFIDASGNVIATKVGTTGTNKKVADFTFEGQNSLVYESSTPFIAVRFTCNTPEKSICLTEVKVIVGTTKTTTYDYVYGRESNMHTDTVTYPEIHWIYTEDSFNEVSYKLYEDQYGLTQATTYVDGSSYYTPTYQEAQIFTKTFNDRKTAGTLYADENGTPLSSTATYTKGGNYYEVGYNVATSIQLNSTINETYSNVNSAYNGYVSAISVFDYYKFGIYSDSSGTRVSLNATFNSNTTYYFKTVDSNGQTVYLPYGTNTGQYRPTVYDSVVGDYIPLSLNATTFEYFKHSLYIDGVRISEDVYYSSNNTYYVDAFVKSNFEQEILDAYNSVLYINQDGQAVGVDTTFNPLRTYYTNVFDQATEINASNFATYKSVLYSDSYGTKLPDDAVYTTGTKYYKKHLIESIPEPSGNVNNEWIEEMTVTRLYSHSKKVTTEDTEALEIYKSDYENLTYTKYPTLYQFTGTNGTAGENIYAEPTVEEVYTPVLAGLISESNWSTYKGQVYTKTGSNYNICNIDWSDTLATVTFYKKVYKTTANITSRNVTYEVGAGYTLGKSATNIFGITADDNVLIWNYNQSGANNTAATMDDILTTANSHYNDASYNKYYGMHYAYNGFTMGSGLVTAENTHVVKDIDGTYSNGYEKGYVYRIVINPEKTGFMWEKIYSYYRKDGADMVTEASTGVAQVGDVIWAVSNCFNGFYTKDKFYRVVNDDFTKTLNVIQFTDVSITNGTGYSVINNEKIHYIYQGDYLGYAGTFEISISAVPFTIVDGKYVYDESNARTYKIKFVGTVIR